MDVDVAVVDVDVDVVDGGFLVDEGTSVHFELVKDNDDGGVLL